MQNLSEMLGCYSALGVVTMIVTVTPTKKHPYQGQLPQPIWYTSALLAYTTMSVVEAK